jgi:iron(III) transport system ATP-binding protein
VTTVSLATLDDMAVEERTQELAVSTRSLSKHFGVVRAVDRIDLDVRPAEILAVLGPSGCGKTTLLRLIAGFERPDGGSVKLAGQMAAGDGRFVPPERRRAGFVFQDYALFPHLSVADNIGYGVADRRRRGERVSDVLRLVGLTGYERRFPHELSGGEQQRVALARALAPQPSIVLLDEPFSNLDADLRERVRGEVRQILREAGATAMFVTHDQEEALGIADRIAVMRDGHIEQVGRPEEIYHTPATRFVADFVGSAEFLPADVEDGRLSTELGSFVLPTDEVEPGLGEIMLRPEDIHLTSDPTQESRVVAREFRGPVNLSTVQLPSGRRVTAAHSSQTLFRPGERVRVAFRPDHLVLFRGEKRVAWVAARARTGTDVSNPPIAHS